MNDTAATARAAGPTELQGFDLTDLDNFAHGFPHDVFTVGRVIWEASANRDERVFRDAMRFDPWRDPSPYLGFGHGIHHCLRANLARLELRVMYRALFARCRGFALTGPVVWARSNKHTGIRRLPIQVTPR